MTSNVVCLIALIIIFAGCSRKSDPTPATGCLLTKRVLSTSGSTITDVFEYDANGILIKYTETIASTGSTTITKIYTLEYANGSVSTITKTVGGVATVATWTVDANFRVIRITEGTSNPAASESTYTYDGDGNLKTWINKAGTSTITLNAVFGSGQLTAATADVVTPGSSSNQPFSYSNFDSKNSPYSLLAKATGQHFFISDTNGNVNPEFLFKSNPGISESDYRTSTGQNDHIQLTFSYEYNAQNYPTKITQTQTGSSSSPAVFTFEYSNCN